MRKALTIVAIVAGLLAALYAGLGYWIAPRFLHQEFAERAARAGLELRLERVHTDPFRLRIELEGLRATGASIAGRTGRVTVDFAWASLWQRAWIVDRLSIHDALLQAGAGEAAGRATPQIPLVVRQLAVEKAALKLSGIELRGVSLTAENLSTRSDERGSYRVAGEIAAGGTFRAQGTVSLTPLWLQGAIAFSAVPLDAVWPAGAPADASASGRSEYEYRAGDLVASDLSLEASSVTFAGIELRQVSLQAANVPIPARKAFEVTARASVPPGGRILASGTLDPVSRSANLRIDAETLALPLAKRWIPDAVAVRIAAGVLSASGTLHASVDGKASYSGNASVSDLRLEERDTGNLLLAWQRADAATLEVSGDALRIARVEVRQPEGRLAIDRAGTLNASAVFRRGAVRSERKFRIAIGEVQIDDGTLHFADRSLANPFQALIRGLSGTIAGFRTDGGEPARVRLAGRVAPAGSARIEGRIDLQSPANATEVTAQFRGLRLATFNPYVVKFAGYRIQSGRISADLRYRVQDGKLQGTNALAFEHMRLGAKVQSAGALDLPLELLVALLADPRGQIDLRIPVSGDLRNPKFDFGAVVAHAIGITLRRIVTAPFRALAGLFGSPAGEEFGQVRFEPGAVQLAPQARRNLRSLARALAQRPALEVSVQGGYDVERDAAALRALTARRMVAERAGVDPPLDLGERKTILAAEQLFLERVGNRLELQALRTSEKQRYGHALVEKLAAEMQVGESGIRSIGRGRAEIVRAALVELGVEPSRLRVDGAERAQAGEHGVPTTLSLRAGAKDG